MNRRQKKKKLKKEQEKEIKFVKFLKYCLDNDIANSIAIDTENKQLIFEKI